MNRQPAVSIITPTWNRRELLGDCLASVQAQSYSGWEHVVVDDDSDDTTVGWLETAASEEPRLRPLRRTGRKRGANVCRNQGIRESRGEFIIFLDSDDLLAPNCLERRAQVMQRNLHLDFATFQTGFFDEKLGDLRQQEPQERFGDDLLRILTFELPWIITGPIWRRSALERLGGFDEALPSWQDVDLHLRAVCTGMHYLRFPEVDHHVRWQFEESKVSIQQRRSPEHLEAAVDILAKFERVVREGPGLDWCRQRALCGLYFFVAERWVDLGRLREALRCWRIARDRALAPAALEAQGAILLRALANSVGRAAAERAIHKWKGWVRFRINPELVGSP